NSGPLGALKRRYSTRTSFSLKARVQIGHISCGIERSFRRVVSYHQRTDNQAARDLSIVLALDPKAMLFDEPTSALDPEMISEVLDVMVELAGEGMTMLVVTHEMGFARSVADRIVFMDRSEIVEDTPTDQFFSAPKSQRAQEFLSKVLAH
ncbi:MAG TPA: hypothetical protein VKP67_07030, partial [Xanthobacteraceae bacterium]|nr:hypothetical protein [Xanthobacteraceae bacterium]